MSYANIVLQGSLGAPVTELKVKVVMNFIANRFNVLALNCAFNIFTLVVKPNTK